MMFYTYLWLRADGTPYYVGKGKGLRAFVRHRKGRVFSPPVDKKRIVILWRPSEQEAFGTERELIRNWGRKDNGTGILHNMTDGGDGTAGKSHTSDVKRKISVALTGIKRSEAVVAKRRGYQVSEGTREKLRIAKLGKRGHPMSAESRAKISAARKGRPLSSATRAAMRAAIAGRVISAETRAKMSTALRGRVFTEAHRLKIIAALKEYYDREFLKTVAW